MTTRRHLLGLLAVPLALAGCAASQAAAAPSTGHPTRPTAWSGGVYTCTYHLREGPLALSVEVSDSDRTADAFFDARRTEATGAEDIVGLGERAFRSGTGGVTVVKDDMTLTVDATALPETFADDGQKRSAFAFEVAADIMGCWTEHDSPPTGAHGAVRGVPSRHGAAQVPDEGAAHGRQVPSTFDV